MLHSRLIDILKQYVKKNYKEYILVGLLFIIGLFAGVFIINNCKDAQLSEVGTYINEFINKFKQIEDVDNSALLAKSIRNNLILSLVIWAAGTTVIGIPVVLAVILFRGVVLRIYNCIFYIYIRDRKRYFILPFITISTKYSFYTCSFNIGSK